MSGLSSNTHAGAPTNVLNSEQSQITFFGANSTSQTSQQFTVDQFPFYLASFNLGADDIVKVQQVVGQGSGEHVSDYKPVFGTTQLDTNTSKIVIEHPGRYQLVHSGSSSLGTFTVIGAAATSASSGFAELAAALRSVITNTGATGRFLKMNVVTDTLATTYQVGSTTNKIIVELVGGGGGGGGANTFTASAAAGGGGAGGSYVRSVFDVVPNTAYTINVGDGGIGASGTVGDPGGEGEDTTFNVGAVTAIARGGGGGSTMTPASTTPKVVQGGLGASVGNIGDLAIFGGGGHAGFVFNGTVGVGGCGGSTVLGMAWGDLTVTGGGRVGGHWGAGGSGGLVVNGSSAANGGTGENGVIVVYEFN